MNMDNQLNIYDALWDPREYLREYYSQDFIPDDEEAFQQRLVAFLKREGRTFARAIDVGCGPTVHLHTALAPYVGELHLADYLPANLNEIQKWLRDEPEAHNWDINIKHVLELETSSRATPAGIEARKQLMRQKVTALKQCDLRRSDPLGEGANYDLVLSAYCVDAATESKEEWQQMIGQLLSLCDEGGVAILLSPCQSRQYQVADKSFPFASVDGADIAAALAAAGFDPRQTTIETVSIKTWAELAFDKVVIAIAAKRSSQASW